MGRYLVVLALDQVKDNVGCESVLTLLVTEPFVACLVAATHHTTLVAESTVGAGVGRKLLLHRLLRRTLGLVLGLAFATLYREHHDYQSNNIGG
jgi:hypothetical protein